MCEQNNVAINMTLETEPQKKYSVSANKQDYYSSGFDTMEEALTAINELVANGFNTITIRDTQLDGVIW